MFPKEQKGIKNRKKKTVSKDTYQKVFEACKGKCGLCGAKDILELHHIFFRSEAPDRIDDPMNCIMLCHKDFSKNKCHQKVHEQKKYWQPRLMNMRKKIK
jgi:5-methylcytosine-specific restriction endonuclease McrA